MENKGNIIIYQTADHQTQIEVKFEEETVWLKQVQIAELFQRDRTVITRHINNIFKEHELEEELVSANFAHTTRHGAIEGKTQEKTATYYNLDIIISVDYRVNSKRGTQFRQWATQRLKEHLIQDYSVNQQRLQQLQQTHSVNTSNRKKR